MRSGLNEMTESCTVAVVLHFRTATKTGDCLRSLCAAGIERTVLVDNSEDGGASAARLAPVVCSLEARGMHITVLSPAENLGFARGVNIGIGQALAIGASQVLLINSDARLSRDALDLLIEGLAGRVGVVAPSLVGEDGVPVGALYYHPLLSCTVASPVPGSIAFLSGACLLLARCVAESEPFDESFFFYGEDVEFSARLTRSGCVLRLIPNAIAVHAGAGSARNGSMFYEYHTVRGHWLLASRLPKSTARRILALGLRIPVLLTRACFRSAKANSLLPARAFLMASADFVRSRCRSLTPPAGECASDQRATG